jgi:hypothetical protein
MSEQQSIISLGPEYLEALRDHIRTLVSQYERYLAERSPEEMMEMWRELRIKYGYDEGDVDWLREE